MAQIPFSVSARAAQLIGRQNFSSAEGAILELVKNSYDADAKNCFVIFDIVYEAIPLILNLEEYRKISLDFANIDTFYTINEENKYQLKVELTDTSELLSYFFSKNSIYIIDNGEGMSKDVIENNWMTIGTGNKEYNYLSADNRIKTGAKGIGRFALDRLGYLTEMWTYAKDESSGFYWQMDWKQFENSDKKITDISAILIPDKNNVSQSLTNLFKNEQSLFSLHEKFDSQSGTIIKIVGLKDIWDEGALRSVFKTLEVLVPPKELDIQFEVHFDHLQNLKQYGRVETAYFNEFDYKVTANFDAKSNIVELSILRDELDLQKVESDFSDLFENKEPPYDLNTIINRVFTIKKTIYELTKWEENDKNRLLFSDVGSFSFTFYFLKLQASQKENYPYKEVNSAERKEVLDRFGGVKIYRDSFRVRPYGDKGNDWLFLGERAAQSPAGAGQRIGDWRVRPNQIAGVINISRVKNKNLTDKSDRGALIENTTFDTFKKIVVSIINEFEIDRTKILNPFYIDAEKKKEEKRKAEIQKEAEKLADKIIADREKEIKQRTETFNFDQEARVEKDRVDYQRIVEKGLTKFQIDDNKDAEIVQVRNLASLGLIVASFAHELKGVRNNLEEIKNLEILYKNIVPVDLKEQRLFKDGLSILNLLKRDGDKTKHWVDYSLSAVKQDKRKRDSLKFEVYFPNLVNQWNAPLQDRNIKIYINNKINSDYEFRAFEMDMNTIFSNLIANSIDAFKNVKEELSERKIVIEYTLQKEAIEIMYSDNATGISSVFVNKDDIFLPFETSKKDKSGNNIGTGLGMYLVKNVVTDNNGTINLLNKEKGFGLQISFPTRNNR